MYFLQAFLPTNEITNAIIQFWKNDYFYWWYFIQEPHTIITAIYKEFEIKDLGQLRYFLGMEAARLKKKALWCHNKSTLFIS